jgi:two-component system, cell cycle sensor histidine kinase and response regulator CckA
MSLQTLTAGAGRLLTSLREGSGDGSRGEKRRASGGRAREVLLESERTYRSLFDSLTELVYIQDLEGRFLNVNRAVLERYGYGREEIVGATPALLIDSERTDLDSVREAFGRAVAGEPQRFEFWGRTKEGASFPKEVTLARGRYFGEDVVIAVARDVSERRSLEEQLRHAQKMEAVGLLAGGIAHDFNNLLNVIGGTAHLLAQESPAGGSLQEDLEEIKQAVDRAAKLTRQLLAFSSQQVLEPELLSLNEVILEMEGMLGRTLGGSIEVQTRLDPLLAKVRADRGQMEQVVLNLAINSRDAMPDGGTLILQTSNAEIDEAFARGFAYPVAVGPYVRLAVADTGAGIPEELKDRVFEPFFTTKERDRGTGLGLPTVYGIVKQSGGYIWLHSREGQGTTVEIMLPRL